MCKAKREIYNQYRSLRLSFELISKKRDEISKFTAKVNGFAFFGCGSSFSLAKSAAFAAGTYGFDKCSAIAAGDYLLSHRQYDAVLKDCCAVFITRSGKTSEMLLAVKTLKNEHPEIPVLLLCACSDAPMTEFAGLSLEFPWAFDESTCQTQTVSNLYAASLLTLAAAANDAAAFEEFDRMISGGDGFLVRAEKQLNCLFDRQWKKVVVLADGVLCGIAEEGALAFNEICMKPSNYYHLLDVRHGPMVLIGPETLVVMSCVEEEREKQLALMEDIRSRGAYLVAVGHRKDLDTADMFIEVEECSEAAKGLRLINVLQLTSLGCALAAGIDPDNPDGLTPWIKL